MNWLVVLDPIEELKPEGDTSLAIVEAAMAAGHEVWATTLDELVLDDDRGRAWSRVFRSCRPLEGALDLGAPEPKSLEDFERILMRKDPPFDMEYIYATYVLERCSDAARRVVNAPAGLRDCNEKVYPLRFPELCPPTRVSRDPALILDFMRAQGGRAVVKPLDMMGGRGVLLLRDSDPNAEALATLSTDGGRQRVMVQGFVEAAYEGDKRILLVDGAPLAAFVRKPKDGDFRGNLSSGATAHPCDITASDEKIIATIRQDLRERGQRFVGIDILGDRLSEVNVTSPMGLRELDALHGGRSADKVVASLSSVAP